jgi:hypothetical protein
MTYEEARAARRNLRATQPVEAPVLNSAVNRTDTTLAASLDEALKGGRIAERDRYFATSLLEGFRRYGSFTEKQRPHVERLVAATPATPVESPDARLGAALEAAIPYVPQRDISFAQSLLNGFKRFGSFTDRQRPYAERFANYFPASLEQAPYEQAPVQAPQKPAETLCPNICSKVNLNGFSRFTVGKLGLSLKNDGSVVWVKWDGKIVGVIDSATTALRTTHRYASSYAVEQALVALAAVEADPLAAARDNGVKTGRCSCCGRPLTDPVSIGFGIGPICRERGFGIVL